MALLLLVNLYASRVILNALGVGDFGIYNVVGGVVSMLSIVTGALNAAILRFLTFEMGKGNMERLKKVFATSLNAQFLLVLFAVLLIETIGIWFLNSKMVIPGERLRAANVVLQFSAMTFCLNLLGVPFNAAIVAHEKMSAFAYIGSLEAGLRLLVAFLTAASPGDRLVTYAFCIFASALFVQAVYVGYGRKHFPECRGSFVWDSGLLRQMMGFVGWSFIGVSSSVLRAQGGNILINLYCGPVVNAARGIAEQIEQGLGAFVQNFMTALNPQITKSYAQENKEYLADLVIHGSRFSFYLLLLLSLPVLVGTQSVLLLWLKIVPAHSVAFVRLSLLFILSESLSNPLITLASATGQIRNYQLIVGGLQSLNFPVSLGLLWAGMAAESVFVVAIGLSQVCLAARLYMLKRMTGFPPALYLRKVYMNILAVGFCAAVVPCLCREVFSKNFTGLIALSGLCCLCTAVAVFSVGLNAREKRLVMEKCQMIAKGYR